MRSHLIAALLLVFCLALSATPLSVRADGCFNCCEYGDDCRFAFDNSDYGQCCGRQGDTVYCCPASLECGQTYDDAVCIRPGTGQIVTYAYHYNHGSSLAAWAIALIVIGGVCCCAICCLMGYRKRQYLGSRWGGGQPAQQAYAPQPGPAPYTVAESYPQVQPGTYAQPPPYGQPYQQAY